MKNKNKLKYLTLSILLTGAVGFSTLAVKQVQVKAENENVVNINRENKKLATFDDVSHVITLTANELNNYIWDNFNDYVCANFSSQFSVSNAIDGYEYNSTSYNFVEDTYLNDANNVYISFSNNGYLIEYNFDDGVEPLNIFHYYSPTATDYLSFEYDLLITCYEEYYDDIKSAIELDIQANESSYGESIITAISSGLGLIPDLAQEFLTGFTTLFWDSAQEKLTDFGTFALVLLGVAITMAVVKLCLAILRSNTGA